jgi:hypothetical protein
MDARAFFPGGLSCVCGAVFAVPIPAWIIALAAAMTVVVAAVALVALMRGRRRIAAPPEPDLFLDVRQLDATGPPPQGARLEFYGTPVRLAVVVVAPAGRQGELPPAGVLPTLLDRLIPGLPRVVADHRPLICRWPTQLSTQGFAQSFFNHVTLPGDRGKGTPWCSIAGRLQVGDRLFLVGLVCCASQPTGLGQFVVQHEGQWLDILRIRDL